MSVLWGRSTFHKPYSNRRWRSRKRQRVVRYAYPLTMPFVLFEEGKED